MPKIEFTVLIPVFNTKPEALFEAVKSCMNQTHKAKEIVLVDDGTTDIETLKVMHLLEDMGCRILTSMANEGTSAALNYGHDKIDTEYIALMGSDDVSHPDRFRRQVQFLTLNPVDVLGTQLFGFDNADIERKHMFKTNHPKNPTANNTANNWFANHGTVFYKNQAVKDVGGYDIAKRRGQDVDLWARMYKAGKSFYNLPDMLYGWRRYK